MLQKKWTSDVWVTLVNWLNPIANHLGWQNAWEVDCPADVITPFSTQHLPTLFCLYGSKMDTRERCQVELNSFILLYTTQASANPLVVEYSFERWTYHWRNPIEYLSMKNFCSVSILYASQYDRFLQLSCKISNNIINHAISVNKAISLTQWDYEKCQHFTNYIFRCIFVNKKNECNIKFQSLKLD